MIQAVEVKVMRAQALKVGLKHQARLRWNQKISHHRSRLVPVIGNKTKMNKVK